jgi:hypothetical protein
VKFSAHGPARGLAAGALAAWSVVPLARADPTDTTVVAAWHPPAVDVSPAPSREVDVGDAVDALPGLIRVPVAGSIDRRGIAFASSAGYGWTESVLGQGDSHDRVFGSLAASVRPVSFFAASLQLDGRYDWHTDPDGSSGFTGDPRLALRVGGPVGTAFHLGAQVGVWLPGGAAPSVDFKAITPDASLLATIHAPDSPLVVTSRVGFRWDNSAQSAPDPERLSLSDRVALGINQASAVLVGLGVAVKTSPRVALLADATWDLLVGNDAPTALQSPIVVSGGVRASLDREGTWQVSVTGATSPSERPVIAAGSPLVDIEPRVSGFVALTVRPAPPAPPAPAAAIAPEPPPVPVAPPPPVVARALVRGRVVTDADHSPVPHAHLVVQTTGGTPKEATTDEQGQFEVDDLDPGAASIDVTAEGYAPVTRTVTLSVSAVTPPPDATPAPATDAAGAAADAIEITLARALPSGQVRGLVRDFSGKPVGAQIRLEPIGVDAQVGTDGMFEVNVAPGAYDVVVHAAGYVDQRRHVSVERDGVTMMNVELRKIR